MKIFNNEDTDPCDEVLPSVEPLKPAVEYPSPEPLVAMPEEKDTQTEGERNSCDPSPVKEGENSGGFQSNVEKTNTEKPQDLLPELRRSTRVRKPPDYFRM